MLHHQTDDKILLHISHGFTSSKDLKDAQSAVKKATENERKFQKTLNVKNREIAELETTPENTMFLLARQK